jgi:hypothetical protein
MRALAFSALIAMFVPVCGAVPAVYALAVENDQAIEDVSTVLDKEAGKLGGTKTVSDHLKKQFHINEEIIYSLRDRKIGYGDITTVLAVAEQMPGGITKDNLEEVVNMRGGHTGDESWNKITDYLGISIDSIVHRTKAVIFTLSDTDEPAIPTDYQESSDRPGEFGK